MKRNEDLVSASSIGAIAFCPHSVELERRNTPISDLQSKKRHAGDVKHSQFNSEMIDSRCFIATHLYGQHANETVVLRNYRDSVLLKSRIGRFCVSLYYRCSPVFVRLSKSFPSLDIAATWFIKRFLRHIENRNR